MSILHHFLLAFILFGFFQGIVNAVFLFKTSNQFKPNRLLALLTVLIALANLNIYFFQLSIPPFWQKVGDMLPLLLFMPVGPLLWLYIRNSLAGEKLSRKDLIHFIPIIFDLIPYVLALVYYIGLTDNKEPLFRWIDFYNVYVDVLRWVSITIYLSMSWRICIKSLQREKMIACAKQLLIVFSTFQLVWLIFLIPYLWPIFQIELLQAAGWFTIYIPLTALVYVLGLIGYRISTEYKKTSGIKLSETEIRQVIGLLEKTVIGERLFLDPKLNLAGLSKHIGVSQKVISHVLNQYVNKNFNEYLNVYRIAVFKQKLAQNRQTVLSLQGIAKECGFNSQATFQRAFKQLTGVSPSEYLKLGSSENAPHHTQIRI